MKLVQSPTIEDFSRLVYRSLRAALPMLMVLAIGCFGVGAGCVDSNTSPATTSKTPSSVMPASGASDGPRTESLTTRTTSSSNAQSATGATQSGNSGTTIEKATMSNVKNADDSSTTAMFGAGCFWGVEYIFRKVPGVTDVACGYAGGSKPNPTYQEVCTDRTGHAEVVQVKFDPQVITYEQLVDTFFRLHDPTQLNRQGPDTGTQYRSVIFYYSPEQQAVANAVKERRNKSGKYLTPITTTLEPANAFWKAEDYHQKYYERNGHEPYCHYLRPE